MPICFGLRNCQLVEILRAEKGRVGDCFVICFSILLVFLSLRGPAFFIDSVICLCSFCHCHKKNQKSLVEQNLRVCSTHFLSQSGLSSVSRLVCLYWVG